MPAVNGFTLTAPDTRYGDSETLLSGTGDIFGGKFVAPSAGTLTITEIGAYIRVTTTFRYARFGIFTHDAVNDCPEDLVANTDEDAEAISTIGSQVKVTHTYDTQPTIVGGTTYWILAYTNNTGYASRFDTGGTRSLAVLTGLTYPTWPTGSAWHTGPIFGTRDYSVYAVYLQTSGLLTASPSDSIEWG